MKAYLFFFAFLMTCMASAQPEGKFLVGGSGSILTAESQIQASVLARFGIFNKSRKVVGGIEAGYAYLDADFIAEAGLFFRSYTYRAAKTGFFLGAGISYAYSNSFDGVSFGPDLGFDIYLSPTAALIISPGFRIVSPAGNDGIIVVAGSELGFTLFL